MNAPHPTVSTTLQDYTEYYTGLHIGGNTFIKLVSDAISHAKMICLNAFSDAHQEIQCVFPNVTELNLRVLMTVHVTQTVLRDVHAPPNKVKRDGSTQYISHIL